MTCQSKNQTDIFSSSEADQWFKRNFSGESKKDKEKDLALKFLLEQQLDGKRILEVGCADGWRLNDLLGKFSCECIGVEPSKSAVEVGGGRFPKLKLKVGTAAALDIEDENIDVLIAGFCLYLCDRKELFKISCEFDRVLNNGGMIVITDFIVPFPYKNRYTHKDGLYSFKMDYGKMFTWNPVYSLIYQKNVDMSSISFKSTDPDNRITLTVLRKDEESAYPLEPY